MSSVDTFSLRMDRERSLAILTWADVQPQLDLWREGFECALDHPDFAPHFGIVSDRRALTRSPDAEFVRAFVTIVSSYAVAGRFRGRWATVVDAGQTASFGMGRMTEILGEQQTLQYRVFTSLDEAVQWAAAGPAAA
jgi:hypothetical protein